MEFKSLTLIDDYNATTLPFASNQFDFLLCKDLLERLLNSEFVIKGTYSALENGFLLAAYTYLSLAGRMGFLFSNEIDSYDYFPGAKCWNFLHIRFLSMRFLRMFEGNGFKIEQNLSHHFHSTPAGRLIPGSALKTDCVS